MPIPKKPGPPTSPKSSAPGKNIPVSEKRLEGLDKESSKPLDEKEVERIEDSEETTGKEKETRGEEKEGGEGESEGEGEDEEDEGGEDESEIEIAKSVKTGSSLLSPEGVIFLPLAILLDLISIILFFFLLDDFFVLDIIGGATIGVWVFYKTGLTPPTPESTGQKAEKAGKIVEKVEKIAAKAGKYGRWLRPISCVLGECIFYLGALPFWTYLVYKTLTDNA